MTSFEMTSMQSTWLSPHLLSMPPRKLIRERTIKFVPPWWSMRWMDTPHALTDRLDIVTVTITEIPYYWGHNPRFAEPFFFPHHVGCWHVISEYAISEFPSDRFFLVEVLNGLYNSALQESALENKRMFILHGEPTLGIGGREIPFELPSLESFYQTTPRINVDMKDGKCPSDWDVLTAILRIKNWDPRNRE